MFQLRPHMCDRAREWASLGLDGELSDFERVLLDSFGAPVMLASILICAAARRVRRT